MPSYVLDEITDEFQNFNPNFNVKGWEWISNFIPHYNWCNYLSMLQLKLIHLSKRVPGLTISYRNQY